MDMPLRPTFRSWICACLTGLICLSAVEAEQMEISFISSYDGSSQQAFALVPDSLADDETRPLVVLAHHAWGNRHSQAYYYPEIEERGWMLVVPELHGERIDGRFSMAAREAQHDLIDALDYMIEHYRVDESRVYLAGRSMGGVLSAVTAAKYPDRFAAVVAGQGVYDFHKWHEWSLPLSRSPASQIMAAEIDSVLRLELGGPFSAETAFTYQRHSAITYASNLQYVPLILWHGTLDELIPADQSQMLATAVRRYNPYQPDPVWLQGAGHLPMNLPASWVLDQLQHYQNKGMSGWHKRFYPHLQLVTDETQQIMWLTLQPAPGDVFGRVEASVTDGLLSVRAEEMAAVTIQLDQIPDWIRFDRYRIQSDRDDLVVRIAEGELVRFTIPADAREGSLPNLWEDTDNAPN